MTKQFKINPDLTCPELAGYRLPPCSRGQEDGVEIPQSFGNSYQNYAFGEGYKSGYTKAREKYEFTEIQLRQAMLFGSMQSKLTPNELKLSFNQLLQSLRTPRTPIAIEVEMDSTKSLLGVWTGFVPALNPDGTVKGRYIYESDNGK